MSENRGRFTWYELLTTDVEPALAFYTDLVGWGRQPWPGPNHYELLTRGGAPVAGALQLPKEASDSGVPPHWMGYIHTPDLDATVAKATELGAKSLAAVDVPQVGRMNVMCDPQGAAIAFFQPDSEPGPETDPQPGDVSWHELSTTDLDGAFDFYSQLFGWDKIDDMDMGEAGLYRIFGRDGRQMGGMMKQAPGMPIAWLYYLHVADIDAAAAKLQATGGTILHGPMVVPGGTRILVAMDPQGGAFALHGPGEV